MHKEKCNYLTNRIKIDNRRNAYYAITSGGGETISVE